MSEHQPSRCHRRCVALVLLLLLGVRALPAQQEIRLMHKDGDRQVASGRLSLDGSGFTGRSESDEVQVTGSVRLSEGGFVREYRREVRRLEQLVSRVSLVAVPSGYRLREEGPISARTMELVMAPVHMIADGSWPESLIPPILERDGGFLRVLFVATREADLVEIRPRERGARYVQLPGGGVTLRIGPDRTFRSLIHPAGGVDILAEGAAPATEGLPAGVSEAPVVVHSGGLELPGSVAWYSGVSRGTGRGVVLLGDEGPRDRDGRVPGSRFGLLRGLAHDLAAEGFVVLRFAKRGSAPGLGGSPGLAELREDARAATLALRSLEQVDPALAVGLVGHGEGALVAVEAARDRPDLFGAVAALAPPARSLARVLERRLIRRLTATGASQEVVAGRLEELRAELGALRDLEGESAAADQRLLRDLLDLDPVAAFKQLRVPFLVVYGDLDEQVPLHEQAFLRSALALGTRVPWRFQVLESADHDFLQAERHRRAVPETWSAGDLDRPRHPALILFLREFLAEGTDAEGKGR